MGETDLSITPEQQAVGRQNDLIFLECPVFGVGSNGQGVFVMGCGGGGQHVGLPNYMSAMTATRNQKDDLYDFTELARLDMKDIPERVVYFAPNNLWFVTANKDLFIFSLDNNQFSTLATVTADSGFLTNVAVQLYNSGMKILTCGEEGKLKLWDYSGRGAPTLSAEKQPTETSRMEIKYCDLSHGCQFMVCALGSMIVVFDVATLNAIGTCDYKALNLMKAEPKRNVNAAVCKFIWKAVDKGNAFRIAVAVNQQRCPAKVFIHNLQLPGQEAKFEPQPIQEFQDGLMTVSSMTWNCTIFKK